MPEWTPGVSVWESGWLPGSKLHCSELERHFVTWKLIIFLINVNIFKGNSVIQLCQPMQALRQRVNQDIILWSYNSEWLRILSKSLMFYCWGSLMDGSKVLFMPIHSFAWPLFKIQFFTIHFKLKTCQTLQVISVNRKTLFNWRLSRCIAHQLLIGLGEIAEISFERWVWSTGAFLWICVCTINCLTAGPFPIP